MLKKNVRVNDSYRYYKTTSLLPISVFFQLRCVKRPVACDQDISYLWYMDEM